MAEDENVDVERFSSISLVIALSLFNDDDDDDVANCEHRIRQRIRGSGRGDILFIFWCFWNLELCFVLSVRNFG